MSDEQTQEQEEETTAVATLRSPAEQEALDERNRQLHFARSLGNYRARTMGKTCGYPTEMGNCKHWAGFRTDHPGKGYCYQHDQDPAADLPEEIKNGPLYQLFQDFIKSPDFFDMTRDIAFTRAAIHSLARSQQMDHKVAGSMAAQVTALSKLISAAHKIALDRRFLIELPQVIGLIETVVQLGRRYIPDDYQRQKFAEELSKALAALSPREPVLGPSDR